MGNYFNCHTHTMYSNIRLLDCINRPKALIDKAIELGLSGIAITDHESLSAHMEVNMYAKKLQQTNPDFKIALGNEIYLVDSRDKGQKYYHFILIAKDAEGHKALRKLSSIAWYNSYTDRGMERVPLLKSELAKVMSEYKGHVIASTACMGGELSTNALSMYDAETVGDYENAKVYYEKIINFITFCTDTFGSDFYLECAPSTGEDQIRVNQKIFKIAQAYKIKMIVGTDAHYMTVDDRLVHKAYLNSKGGEREVDAFYEFARLMNYDECQDLLSLSFNGNKDIASWILENTLEVQNKIEFYSLEKTQKIPRVDVKDYPAINYESDFTGKYNPEWNFPAIDSLLCSNEVQERYWINECLDALKDNKLYNTEYLQRIEIEADIVKYIGEQLHDCLFAYFNTFKHYIDLFWECGSIVGPGRGSATGFLSNYLLGITQLDPIRWDLPYWRFLNRERAELPDIDIDLAPSKRPEIFRRIRNERGELGLVQVATFGTEGTKSAILTACRGYNSKDFPDGIDSDTAQYMSSMIPSHRGFLWPIKDVVYGNEAEDRKPVSAFIREVNQYEGLLDIITSIEGLVNKRSSHASGVILYGDDPCDTSAFMRTPSGDLVTQYDLHMAEASGDTKYDFLVTEVSDKIIKCVELLVADKKLPGDLSLREIYNKYLHPEVIDTSDQRIWDHLSAGDVLDVFQFSTGVGLQIAKRLKPQNPIEMTAANALMRLMSERDKESPQDRYVRIQRDPESLDRELSCFADKDSAKRMYDWLKPYYGTVPLQELMMEILMDISNFTLAEANDARKIVAKKQMSRIPELKAKLYDHMSDKAFADYTWEVAIAPSLGYAFSKNHSLPYSFVGIQTIYLAMTFNPIYWNTACLIVNSGATDEENGNSTDYGKIAKAIGDIQAAGINVSLANINKSTFGFAPDIDNNRILFGLKGMLNVGDDVINSIVANRPYASPKDFLNRIKPGKQAMIALIKGGAFDEMMDRKEVMVWYIWETCDKKKRITLQNMSGLIKHNLLPETGEDFVMARRVYEFNRYLKSMCKYGTTHYALDERAIGFMEETRVGYDSILFSDVTQPYVIEVKAWDKIYQSWMDIFRNWIASDKDNILKDLNASIFMEDWKKYASGNISSWEMEVLCFYYHKHELSIVNNDKYGFANFFALPEDPVVDRSFVKAGKTINIFKLNKICGTCIAKNKTKSTVTLLTTDGVVNVKFRKEYFSMFDKQISEKGADGVKHIVEKSWFNRGNMIVVMGIRSGDDFISKKYASSGGHQLYKIDELLPNGDLVLKDGRYQGGVEEDV